MPERCIAGGWRPRRGRGAARVVFLGCLCALSVAWGRPRTGRILVTAEVAGAEIAIDGDPIGQTPMALPFVVPAGKHEVRVTKAGHAPFVAQVKVKGGRDLTVRAVLVATAAILTVRSTPPGARVAVDGQARGVTPLVLELDVQARLLELAAEGFLPHREPLALVAGEGLRREVALVPRPAPVVVEEAAWYRRGWVWAAAGAVVAGAVVTAVVLSADGAPQRGPPTHSLTFEPVR